MSRSGKRWIRLQAAIFDHYMFDGQAFSERDAFTWLITQAAWADTSHMVGSKCVPVPRGSLFVTLRQLTRIWNWKSDTRVRNFLKKLSAEGMIVADSNAQKKTLITICNYAKYQDVETGGNANKTQEKREKNALKIPDSPIHIDSEKERLRDDHVDLEEFHKWFKAWPSYPTDDEDAAIAAWQALTEEERVALKAATPDFIEVTKTSGRTMYPSAAKYLKQKLWKRLDKIDGAERKLKRVPEYRKSSFPYVLGGSSKTFVAMTPEEKQAARNRRLAEAHAHNASWG